MENAERKHALKDLLQNLSIDCKLNHGFHSSLLDPVRECNASEKSLQTPSTIWTHASGQMSVLVSSGSFCDREQRSDQPLDSRRTNIHGARHEQNHAGDVKQKGWKTLGGKLSLIDQNLEDVDVMTSHDEVLVC